MKSPYGRFASEKWGGINLDPRLVENRLLFDENKKPTGVEMRLVTRNADGSAREEKVVSFPWPA